MNKELGLQRYLGTKVFEARCAAGMTQSDLAQKIGVTASQVLKYENGTHQISLMKLISIAEALSLNLDYFLANLKSVEWDDKTIQDQRMNLNVSNNFMKIQDQGCKKAVSNLLSVLARIT